jgi:hypothetical protein
MEMRLGEGSVLWCLMVPCGTFWVNRVVSQHSPKLPILYYYLRHLYYYKASCMVQGEPPSLTWSSNPILSCDSSPHVTVPSTCESSFALVGPSKPSQVELYQLEVT